MSETEKTNITLPFMSATDIARLSVSALSNRPSEHSGQYGRKGLTPEELKAAFSALPKEIAEKLNELLPKILARFGETETMISDTETALREAIAQAITEAEGALGASITAEASARADADAQKVDRMRPSEFQTKCAYLYGEAKDGGTVLFKGNVFAEPSTLVYRDDNGQVAVNDPTAQIHAVNRRYFDDKSRNSLYSEVSDITRRMRSLEYAASGNIYNTETLSGSASAVQVDDALPYGVLTRLGGNVAKVTSGLPYTLSGAACHSGKACTVKGDSVIMPKGERYYVKLPCVLPSGATVTVRADGQNSAGEKVFKFLFRTKNADASAEAYLGNSVTLESASAYLCITKYSANTPLTADLEISNIQVLLGDPASAEIYPTDEIEVPAEVRALSGYGAAGAFIDLTERKFCDASGNATDISAMLPEEFDVISLLPFAILKFTDTNGNAVTADYELNYKNKIQGETA